MATDPAHQKRGAAQCLLGKLTDLADEAGKDAYLISTDAGKSVYTKAGFMPVRELVLDLALMGEREGKERFTVSATIVIYNKRLNKVSSWFDGRRKIVEETAFEDRDIKLIQ
jgi:hypothetical protein